MTLRLNGSTSGSVSLDAPATGSNVSLELPTDSIKPGLVLVAAQSFSAVSSVSVNNCFTATYETYRIIGEMTGSTALGAFLRLRSSGTDASGSNYDRNEVLAGASSLVDTQSNNQTFVVAGAANTSRRSGFYMDVFAPFLAQETSFIGLRTYPLDDMRGFIEFGGHNLATSYDGFTLYPNTGTVTGSLQVFGYRKTV